jgi:hypothetical protein
VVPGRLAVLIEGLREGRLEEATKLPDLSPELHRAMLDVLHGVGIAKEKGVYPVSRMESEDLRGLRKHRLVKVEGSRAILTPKGIHYLHKKTRDMRARLAVETLRMAAEHAAERRKKEREFKKKMAAHKEAAAKKAEVQRLRVWKKKHGYA